MDDGPDACGPGVVVGGRAGVVGVEGDGARVAVLGGGGVAEMTMAEALVELVDFSGVAAMLVQDGYDLDELHHLADVLRKHCADHGIPVPLVIAADIELLDEAAMAVEGWYRLTEHERRLLGWALSAAAAATGPTHRQLFMGLASRFALPENVTEAERG